MKKLAAIALLATGLNSPGWAAPETITLLVPGMTCAGCPITVKTALTRVVGVDKVEVSFETREAVVTFDDTKTGAEALTDATANMGYPSSVKH